MTTLMPELLPCPFCGDDPYFEGDADDWKDDSRYVQMSLKCCTTMNEAMGWIDARCMTVEARTAELQIKLSDRWNTRAAIEASNEGDAKDAERISWPKEKRVGRREDMSPDGTLIVGLDSDNDVYIEVSADQHGEWQSAAVEFCNGGGGGGQSSRTRAALINLMTAIEADNAERPHKAFPPTAATPSQVGVA